MNEQRLRICYGFVNRFILHGNRLIWNEPFLFGHTPTMNLYPRSENRWGEVWHSSMKLSDGRSASIGMDTCVFHKTGPTRSSLGVRFEHA
jgi:hypothetical protein